MSWYQLTNPGEVISPSLLFYKGRIESNIRSMVNIAGSSGQRSADRLVPHVKTHKCPEIVAMQLSAGISKFKCATIAEAEMVATAGAPWVLIAYQLVGPNIDRLFALRNMFPDTTFASLVDNEQTATLLSEASRERGLRSAVFLDVNNGMNRTGHATDESLLSLYRFVSGLDGLSFGGVHIYDGHIRNPEFSERKAAADEAYEQALPLLDRIETECGYEPMIILENTLCTSQRSSGAGPTRRSPLPRVLAEIDSDILGENIQCLVIGISPGIAVPPLSRSAWLA